MTTKETERLENNAFVHSDLAYQMYKSGNEIAAAMYLGRYFAETEILGLSHVYDLPDELFFQMIEKAREVEIALRPYLCHD